MITIRGKVKKGQGRGKALEFPTANMRVEKSVPEGVYISYTLLDEKELPSLTFIGKAETFGETKYQAETFILDFSDSLYGVWITVRLVKKIRGGKKFRSPDELVKQMEKDTEAAKEYFQKSTN